MINTSFLKDAIIVIICLVLVYFVFKINLPKPAPVIPTDLIHQIDSLKAENARLQKCLHINDSIITDYKFQISILDSQIVGIETKTVVIKEKAHETSTKIKKYKNDEVDSFFKDRYKY